MWKTSLHQQSALRINFINYCNYKSQIKGKEGWEWELKVKACKQPRVLENETIKVGRGLSFRSDWEEYGASFLNQW